MNKIKKIRKVNIPKFKNEDDERRFWAKADTTKYFDISRLIKFDVSKLQPSTKVVTIRFPEHVLYTLKRLAKRVDVPYQSLAKTLLADAVERGRRNVLAGEF